MFSVLTFSFLIRQLGLFSILAASPVPVSLDSESSMGADIVPSSFSCSALMRAALVWCLCVRLKDLKNALY